MARSVGSTRGSETSRPRKLRFELMRGRYSWRGFQEPEDVKVSGGTESHLDGPGFQDLRAAFTLVHWSVMNVRLPMPESQR